MNSGSRSFKFKPDAQIHHFSFMVTAPDRYTRNVSWAAAALGWVVTGGGRVVLERRSRLSDRVRG